jgi:hypothetical protein
VKTAPKEEAPGSRSLVFRGPPHRLSAFLPLRNRPAGSPPEVVDAQLEGVPIEDAHTRSSRGAGATLRLRVSASTAPGRYVGTATVGERSVPIVAEVDPRVRLLAQPRPLVLHGQPGADAEAAVVVTNVGNVRCEVPGRSSVGLLPENAWGAAFWKAISTRATNGGDRVATLLDELARGAALVRVTVEGADTTLRPGDARELHVRLRLPESLVGGTYIGTWEPPGLGLPVRVVVVGAPRRIEEAVP